MDKQEDITIKEGETKLVDSDGHELFTIELTPNMIVVLRNGTSIIKSWRNILNAIVDWSKLGNG